MATWPFMGKVSFMSTSVFIGVAIGVAFFAFSTVRDTQAAQTIPYKMNFQGRLANNAGNAMPDGLYNMQFRLYDASSGGTLLWSETRQTTARVQVTNGLFSTQLGDVNSLDPAHFNSANPRYFEITLATPATATCTTSGCAVWESPMTPRQALGSAGYAMNADTVDGIDADQLARRDASNTFTGTSNIFRNTSNSTGSFQIQDAAGDSTLTVDTQNKRIGIGTATPAAKLHIVDSSDWTGVLLNNSNTGEAYAELNIQNNVGAVGSFGLGGAGVPYAAYANRAYVYSGPTAAGISLVANSAAGDIRLFAGTDGAANERLRINDAGVQVKSRTANSTTAFEIQNAAGTGLFTADTTAGAMSVSTAVGDFNIRGVANPAAPALSSSGC